MIFPSQVKSPPFQQEQKQSNKNRKMGSCYIELSLQDWSSFHCGVNSLDLELKSSPARLALLFPVLASFVICYASLPAFVIWSQLLKYSTSWMNDTSVQNCLSYSHNCQDIIYIWGTILTIKDRAFLPCLLMGEWWWVQGQAAYGSVGMGCPAVPLFSFHSMLPHTETTEPCSCEVLCSELGQLWFMKADSFSHSLS